MPDIRKVVTRNLQDRVAGDEFLQLRTSMPKQNPKAGSTEAVIAEAINSSASGSKYILVANFILNLTYKYSLQ